MGLLKEIEVLELKYLLLIHGMMAFTLWNKNKETYIPVRRMIEDGFDFDTVLNVFSL